MKRRLLIAAVFLLAGAVVNVAVAWGCALWLQWPQSWGEWQGRTRGGPTFNDWLAGSTAGLGFARVQATWLVDSEFSEWDPDLPAEEVVPPWATFARPGASPKDTFRIADARGWPVVSLWSGLETQAFLGPVAIVEDVAQVKNGYLLPSERGKLALYIPNLRVIPFAPIWPGFAVNTLFYATFLWLLICGPFALRHFIRVRRGLCPACAYPRSESDVCSECGKSLPSRRIIV